MSSVGDCQIDVPEYRAAGRPARTSTVARSRSSGRVAALLLACAATCMTHGSWAADNTTGPDAAKPPAQQVRFDVHEYRVLGNTVLAVRDIERVLYPLLGDGKQFSDVQAARAALEKLYHDRGYGTVFVDIPPQQVSDGVVRLHVTEGTLHASKISGARYFSEQDILGALPALSVGGVPNLPLLQQQLSTLNAQTADRSIVPVLKAGPAPGTVDVELRVNDKLPLHGSLELDNDYTVDTEPLRATAAVTYSNLFAELDTISLQYQDSPQKPAQVQVGDLSYQSRPFAAGARVSASFIDSNSNVSNIGLGGLGVLGKGQIFSTRVSLPLATPTPSSLQSLSLGVDYKHFTNAVTVGGGSQLITPISYVNLSAAYAGAWNTAVAETAANVSANFGPRNAPNSPDEFENDRFLARPNYFYLRGDSSVTGHLPGQLRLTLRLTGQWADEPLISNENFAVGGADGVRGYLEAEELGDAGVKGTLQLQSPTWSWRLPQLVNAFVFYDSGLTRTLDPLVGQAGRMTLRSFGGGINLLPGHEVGGVLSWADPLDNGSYTRAYQSRVLFSVRGSF